MSLYAGIMPKGVQGFTSASASAMLRARYAGKDYTTSRARRLAAQRRYQREWRARQVARWRAAGCCLRCGMPDRQRYTRCVVCRERIALYMRRWRAKRRGKR